MNRSGYITLENSNKIKDSLCYCGGRKALKDDNIITGIKLIEIKIVNKLSFPIWPLDYERLAGNFWVQAYRLFS